MQVATVLAVELPPNAKKKLNSLLFAAFALLYGLSCTGDDNK